MATAATAAAILEGATVFTDLVGFTEFTALYGDAMAANILEAQEQIVREELPAGARVVKELGDGMMLWFPDACAAVSTALRLQRRAEEESAAIEMPLWARIGIHWGRQMRRRDDLVGHDVNVAARVVDVAGPGEVVVSEATKEKVGDGLPGVEFDEIGPVFMKGIPAAMRLYRVASEER